jgi:hypothetical protein
MSHLNTPAAAWAWLTRRLSDLDETPGRSINREWSTFRSEHDGRDIRASSLTDWPSDFWIAKTQRAAFTQLVPVWVLPERLDHWPTLELREPFTSALPAGTATNSAAFLAFLTGNDPGHALSQADSVRRFTDLLESSTARQDEAMISANQIRAWIAAAFGGLLGGIAFTPADDSIRETLIEEVKGRIASIDSFEFDNRRYFFFDYGCDGLYNSQVTRSGLRAGLARQGQGADWQHAWAWLSAPQDAAAMMATLQLAGQLLINEPLLAGLIEALRDGNDDSQKRALCVTRRWLLTAKVLAWLFEALRHDWTWVRPQDLACFAFAALSPAWPRRAVAISHRSGEAKPVLSQLKMWESPHVAIDAAYVPAWETNTGMIWNLFAPVPLIARVASPEYFESEWCNREYEMFQYLIEGADFLEGRVITDIGVAELAGLDATLFGGGTFSAPEGEFPPFSMVLVGDVPSAVDLAVIRAAGALRLINALVKDPGLANAVAARAAAGDDIGIDPPTNNPDGWAAYGEIFRDLQAALLPDTPGDSLSLTVPADYSAGDAQLDVGSAAQIPDLSGGNYRLADVLAAFEWRRTVLIWFNDEGYGDKVMVDVSQATVENWDTLPDFSVARGLLALNGSSPTWIMQRAGQQAHLWPGFQQQPVFTRYIDAQFNWLKPVMIGPTWLIYYLANCGLGIDAALQATMIAAVVQTAGRDAIQLVAEGEGANLAVPSPGEFFEIPTDALSDVYSLIDDMNSRQPRRGRWFRRGRRRR